MVILLIKKNLIKKNQNYLQRLLDPSKMAKYISNIFIKNSKNLYFNNKQL